MTNVKPKFEILTRVGETNDGRYIYATEEKNGKRGERFTIPKENGDKFEKVLDKFSSDLQNMTDKKNIRKAQFLMGGMALTGGGLTLFLTKKRGLFMKWLGASLGALVGGITGGLLFLKPIFDKGPMLKAEFKELGLREYKG